MTVPRPITISVVTASYQQPEWLRLCVASVADQAGEGLTVEHIVQDSLSGPEIAEALKPFPKVKLFSEKDAGMYDAINRGWEKSTGDILCWLNCDEQYLPGALDAVAAYFREHPETEVLFADAFVVDTAGNYICSRQVLVPLLYHTWICHVGTLSCATFFRRDLIRERGFMVDTRWKSVGDGDLIKRLLLAKVDMQVLQQYLSVFVDTGDNLSLRPIALDEMARLASEAPGWAQALRRFWVVLHRVRRMVFGLYRPKPFSADIYTLANPAKRIHLDVPNATFHWKGRVDWRS
jgi:glycosyltransferase involved in cell wall biosynthesis